MMRYINKLEQEDGSKKSHPVLFDPPGNPNPGKSGAIAQLGERLNGIQEVSGSIPLSSTKLFQLRGAVC